MEDNMKKSDKTPSDTPLDKSEKSKTTFISLALVLAKYLPHAYLPIVQCKYRNRKYVPPIEDLLFMMSATDLAQVIRKREISSEIIVKAYIKRIKEVNPVLNAVIDERFDDALVDAKNADKFCQEHDSEYIKEHFPLLGVPFTCKEAVGVEGLSHHVGVVERKGMKCEKEGPVIRNLRKAGAIPLCVTNIPEWCLSWETHNLLQGRTYNPYNTVYSPGGSSGGEAALIGAAASIFGVGSDFMGSCRLPAAFCGVYGHRITRPLIDLEGSLPVFPDSTVQKILSLGPLCRYAKDLPLLLKIMSGKNASQANLHTPVDISTIKILIPNSYPNSTEDLTIDDEIIHKINASVDEFTKAGITVEKVKIQFNGLFERLIAKYFSVDVENITNTIDIPVGIGTCVKEYGKWAVGMSSHNIYNIHFQFLLKHCRLVTCKKDIPKIDAYEEEFKTLLGTNSVIIFPTFPTAAYKHHGMVSVVPGMVYLLVASVFNLPATTIPMGLNKQGLPIGLQVIAGPFQDRLCFAVAQFLESKFGGWVPPPSNS